MAEQYADQGQQQGQQQGPQQSQQQTQQQGQQQGGGQQQAGQRRGNEVALGKNIRIDLTQRIPQLDMPHAYAYAASDARQPGEPRYAMICSEEAPPRLGILPSLSRLEAIPAVVPMDWGRVLWDEHGTRRLAIIQQQPSGAPMSRDINARLEPMREDRLVERVVRPIYHAINELSSRMVTHRAITLSNVFVNEAAGGECVLGDCVSAPAGTVQPAIFETISGAQADTIGRGPGGTADDLYALGVLIAILVRGGNPMPGWSPSAIAEAKIEKGSYAALMGRQRISLKLMEPLRGLLCDEVEERWKLNDVDMWLNGRQLSPMQASLPPKARRAFEFMGQGFWNAKSLAHAMANNWRDAIGVLSQGEIEQWARRSLPDEKHANRIVNAVLSSQQTGATGSDRALARVLIALDPSAPIRLRGLGVKIEALQTALCLAYDDDKARQRIVEMIVGRLANHWLDMQPEEGPDPPQPLAPFDRMSFYLERRSLGQGIERCLYQFNTDMPCLSPLVYGQYVVTLEQLMASLERTAEKKIPAEPPWDRHVAAFIAARMDRMPDKVIQGIAKVDDPLTHHRAALHMMARVQRYYGPVSLPRMCEWVRPMAEKIVDSMHNQHTKEKLHKMLAHAVETGSLVEVLAAVDDPEARREDQDGFERARQEYAQNLREMTWLESGGLTSEDHVQHATRNWATTISALLSGVITMVVMVYFLS